MQTQLNAASSVLQQWSKHTECTHQTWPINVWSTVFFFFHTVNHKRPKNCAHLLQDAAHVKAQWLDLRKDWKLSINSLSMLSPNILLGGLGSDTNSIFFKSHPLSNPVWPPNLPFNALAIVFLSKTFIQKKSTGNGNTSDLGFGLGFWIGVGMEPPAKPEGPDW